VDPVAARCLEIILMVHAVGRYQLNPVLYAPGLSASKL